MGQVCAAGSSRGGSLEGPIREARSTISTVPVSEPAPKIMMSIFSGAMIKLRSQDFQGKQRIVESLVSVHNFAEDYGTVLDEHRDIHTILHAEPRKVKQNVTPHLQSCWQREF